MKKKILSSNFIILTLLFLSLVSCRSAKEVTDIEPFEPIKKEAIDPKVTNKEKSKINKILVYLGDESVAKWKLITLDNKQASTLFTNLPQMRFDEVWKQMYGSTGCNKFTAYYDKNGNTLVISRITSTELSCDSNYEGEFLNQLRGVNEINESLNSLSLLQNGRVVLEFEKFY